MKLIKRTFVTNDFNGCEFKCEAFYGDGHYEFTRTGKLKPVRDCDFYAIGIHAKTLHELKKIISNIK